MRYEYFKLKKELTEERINLDTLKKQIENEISEYMIKHDIKKKTKIRKTIKLKDLTIIYDKSKWKYDKIRTSEISYNSVALQEQEQAVDSKRYELNCLVVKIQNANLKRFKDRHDKDIMFCIYDCVFGYEIEEEYILFYNKNLELIYKIEKDCSLDYSIFKTLN